MIGSLRGTVLERTTSSHVLLEVGGVGYMVTVTPRTLAELEPSSSAFLYVHHHIREDAQTLFGFLSSVERQTFEALISAHGIGPAVALAILGTYQPSALVDIVASNDIASLTLVPGVGKKTAERMLLELKNKLSIPVLESVGAGAGGSGTSAAMTDVREALGGLGYGPEEIRDVLRELSPSQDASVLLREALKALGAKRA